MYLLDTNVISEMRKVVQGRATPGLKRWMKTARDEDMFVSTITLLESETGILRLRRKDSEQAELLWAWLHQTILPSFAGRILGVDTTVALRCATLHVPKTAPYRDSLIAATALVHGMSVVTRNVKDFEPMGVKVLNPWDD